MCQTVSLAFESFRPESFQRGAVKSIPLVADYQEALKANNPDAEPGFVSLEGYMVGRIAIMALAKIDGEVTRQKLMDVIASTGSFDLGGVTLTYGPDDNQGMDQVFLTVIQPDGSFKAVERLGDTG